MALADFGYVQARMQARYGERLDEPRWRQLEASRELAHLLDGARATPWARWASHLATQSDAHAVTRALRNALRDHVHEVAAWTPDAWREAVSWTAWLVDLPAIDRFLSDEPPPAFAHDDPVLGAFAADDRSAREAAMRAAGLGEVVDASLAGETARAGWLRTFRALWPNDPRAAELLALTVAVADHVTRMAAGPDADGDAERRALLARVQRLFRWRARRPVAVWAYLAITALDLERFRAALVRLACFREKRERGASAEGGSGDPARHEDASWA